MSIEAHVYDFDLNVLQTYNNNVEQWFILKNSDIVNTCC